MPLEETHEGLVLKSLDYKDRQKIITLFTPTRGLISLIVKGITRKKTPLLTLTTPFTHGEYHFHIGRTELYTFRDGTLLNTHSHLRQSLAHLETATAIAKALLSTQFPGKPAPKLYKLTLSYLKNLSDFSHPQTLATSFLLKLLKHDGHLALSPTCSFCEMPPSRLHDGESFCTEHSPAYAHSFQPLDWDILTQLTGARSFDELKRVHPTQELHQKVEKIFQEKH